MHQRVGSTSTSTLAVSEGDEVVGLKLRKSSFHALQCVGRSNLVRGHDFIGYVIRGKSLRQSSPNQRSRFVELIVLLRVEVDENSGRAVKLCKDNVIVRSE